MAGFRVRECAQKVGGGWGGRVAEAMGVMDRSQEGNSVADVPSDKRQTLAIVSAPDSSLNC